MTVETRLEVIAVYVSKGGVGKTTICKNLAALARAKGKRVLVVDLDTQGHITTALKMKEQQLSYFVQDWLLDRAEFKEVVKTDERTGLDFIPANEGLSEVEMHLLLSHKPAAHKEKFLKNKLDNVKELYDIIFIDTHPSGSNQLMPIIMTSSTKILIPYRTDEKDEKELVSSISNVKLFQEVGYELDVFTVANALDLRSMKTEYGYILDTIKSLGILDKQVCHPIRYSTSVGKNTFKNIDLTQAGTPGAKKIMGDYQEVYKTLLGSEEQ